MARPPKLKPEEVKEKLDQYFEELESREGKINPPTLIDIAHYLGISYSTYQRYRGKSGYEQHIKKGEERVINWWIRQLAFPGRPTTGIIFYLKNRAGFSDKQEVQHQVKGQIEHTKQTEKLSNKQVKRINKALEALEEKENSIDVTPEDEASEKE